MIKIVFALFLSLALVSITVSDVYAQIDTTNPITPDLVFYVTPNSSVSLTSLNVTDDTNPFDELTFTLGTDTPITGVDIETIGRIFTTFNTPVFFPNSNAPIGTYTFPYTVEDRSNNSNSGTITLHIVLSLGVPDNTAPTTPPITPPSVIQGERGVVDFSTVTDADSFPLLRVVFYPDDAAATGGNILDNVRFTQGVNGTTSPVGVFYPIVRFIVDSDANVGTYTFPYTVTDIAGNTSDGTVTITITVAFIDVPITPDTEFSVNQGASANVDFGGVIDDTNSDFIITIVATGDILNRGDFKGNISDYGTNFVVNDINTVTFAANYDATAGVYSFPYRATNDLGNSSSGTITITIVADPSLAGITAPVATNLSVSVNTSSTSSDKFGTISFGTLTDNFHTFDQLTITFKPSDVTGPNSILTQGSFTDGITFGPFYDPLYTVTSQDVTFRVNSNAVAGDYTFPYTVAGLPGLSDSGEITITIVDGTKPTIPNIYVFVNPSGTADINFSGISDNTDSFANLDVTINANGAGTVGDILAQGSFDSTDVSPAPGDATSFAVNDNPVTFTALQGATAGVYIFPYTVTDTAGNSRTGVIIDAVDPITGVAVPDVDKPRIGTITINIVNDATAPNASDLVASVVQGETVDINFGAITDGDSFDNLSVIFRTNGPDIIGNILGNGTFSDDDVTNHAPSFTVLAEMVEFRANPDAVPGIYEFQYAAIDSAGNYGLGKVTITITAATDTTAPTAPNIPVSVSQNGSVNIDFSSVTDTRTAFDQLSILIDVSASNAQNQGRLTSGVTALGNGDFDVTSPSVTFTASSAAVSNTYTLSYTVTDASSNTSTGTVTITIAEDTTAPTTPNLTSSTSSLVAFDYNVDFSSVIDDTDAFADLRITLDPSDFGTTSNILEQGGFTSGVNRPTGSVFTVNDPIVTFRANPDAISNTYTFSYMATDRKGLDNPGTVSIILLNDLTSPTTPDISVFLRPGASVDIDFSGVTDTVDSDLTITFNTNGPQIDGVNILTQGTFTNGVTGFGTIFTVNDQTVTFTANSNAVAGLHTIPYTARDDAGNSNSGDMIIDIDATAPTTPDITGVVRTSQFTDLSFSGVSDDNDDFNELTVTLIPVQPMLNNGVFTGVSGPSSSFTVDSETIRYTANNVVNAPGIYSALYIVADRAGNTSLGKLTIILDNTAPTAPPLSIYMGPSESSDIDFPSIYDNIDTFEQLTITFTSHDPAATPSLPTNGGFTAGVDGTGPSFTVNSRTVSFATNLTVISEEYTLSYSVADRAGNRNSGSITIVIDDENPNTQVLESSGSAGENININFGAITDNVDSFEELTITFDTDLNNDDASFTPYDADPDDPPNAGLLAYGDFTSGVNDITTPFTVVSETVIFAVNNTGVNYGPPPGEYEFPFIVTDRAGNSSMEIARIIIGITTYPTTPNISVNVAPLEDIVIDLSAVLADRNADNVFFHFNDPSATGGNILEQGSFRDADIMLSADDDNMLTGSTPVFTTNFDAIPGLYTFPYTAVDRFENIGFARIAINIVPAPYTPSPLASPTSAPTAPPISVSVNQGSQIDIVFTATDSDSSDEQLTFAFDTASVGNINDLGTFSGATNVGTFYTATTSTVMFNAISSAEAGEYVIPYLVTDNTNNANRGEITITIVDVSAPAVPPISISLDTGASSNLDFSGVIDETDSFDELTITFDPANSAATGGNILSQVVFNSATVTVSGTDHTVNAPRVIFSVNEQAAVGTYTIPYTARDGSNNFDNTGVISITITAAPVIEPGPNLPGIVVFTPPVSGLVEQIRSSVDPIVQIDFGIISDDQDDFTELTITFDTNDPARTVTYGTGPTEIGGNVLDIGNFISGRTMNEAGSTEHTVVMPSVLFQVTDLSRPVVYTIPYSVVDSDSNPSSSVMTIHVVRDHTPPSTTNLRFNAIANSESRDLQFQGITDTFDESSALTITIHPNGALPVCEPSDSVSETPDIVCRTLDPDAPVVGNILAQGNFTSGVTFSDIPYMVDGAPFVSSNGTTLSVRTYTVNSQPVTFTTHANPAAGEYDVLYTVVDSARNSASNVFTIIITDNVAPTVTDFAVSVKQNQPVTLDFSDVKDETDSFDQLTILIDASASAAILAQGSLTGDIILIGDGNYDVTSPSVTFMANDAAVRGTYTFSYTARDSANNLSAAGTITITIEAGLAVDTTTPTTPPIEISIDTGDPDTLTDTLDFSTVVDPPNTDALVITFDPTDSNAVGDILDDGVFTSGTTLSGTTHTVTSQSVIFTASPNAVAGIYTIPYTATDGTNTSSNTITITIVDKKAPANPPITIYLNQDAFMDLDFSGVRDETNSFDELTIVFDTANSNAVGDILAQGSFDSTAVTLSGTEFTVISQSVRFTTNAQVESGIYTIPYTATDRANKILIIV